MKLKCPNDVKITNRQGGFNKITVQFLIDVLLNQLRYSVRTKQWLEWWQDVKAFFQTAFV